MLKKLILSFAVLALVLSTTAITFAAETSYIGSVVKTESSATLYYVASDGKRYLYPNEKVYKSWFTNFSDVITISEEEMAAIPLGKNIRYRPGIVLVKIIQSPKVYAVSNNGLLRWIRNEALARALYGEDWASLIDDIDVSIFSDYNIGEDIDEDEDYDADKEAGENDSVEKNRGLKLGHAKRANTTKCRAIPAIPAIPGGPGQRATPAIPAIPARVCKMMDDDDDDQVDETVPIISDILVTLATSTAPTSTATITWITNEEADSKVEYAAESLTTASTTDSVSDSTLVTNHSIDLIGLTASTTYYFIVESEDASSNQATSTEQIFTTE